MSIEYDAKRKRFFFSFKKTIHGEIRRVKKQLPEGYSRAQAQDYDIRETARLYELFKDPSKSRVLISDCVLDYMMNHLPEAKDGYGIAKELERLRPFFEGHYVEELAAVGAEYKAAESARLAPATIKNKLSYLRAACVWVQKNSATISIDQSLRLSISMPKVNNQRHFYMTRGEILLICKHCENRVARAVIRVAFYSGMRISEILLAGENVGSMKKNLAFLLEDTKNGDRRLTPIHRKLMVLRRFFPLPFKKRWIQRLIRRAMDAAGYEKYVLHDVRHSAASALINSGATLYEVNQVLGHKSLESTARYAHIDLEVKKAALDRIR